MVRRLPGNVGEVTTNTHKRGSDVVAVDGLQVMHCQLLRIVAAVEIDIYAQQELVEPGGSVAGPRPVHDRSSPVGPDKQVVSAEVSVEEATARQAMRSAGLTGGVGPGIRSVYAEARLGQ